MDGWGPLGCLPNEEGAEEANPLVVYSPREVRNISHLPSGSGGAEKSQISEEGSKELPQRETILRWRRLTSARTAVCSRKAWCWLATSACQWSNSTTCWLTTLQSEVNSAGFT